MSWWAMGYGAKEVMQDASLVSLFGEVYTFESLAETATIWTDGLALSYAFFGTMDLLMFFGGKKELGENTGSTAYDDWKELIGLYCADMFFNGVSYRGKEKQLSNLASTNAKPEEKVIEPEASKAELEKITTDERGSGRKYISNLGEMPEEDAIRYDGYWKYQEALKRGEFNKGSIYDGWYNPDGSMNYPDNWGAVPGTEEVVTLGGGDIIVEVKRYGVPTDTSEYVTEISASIDRLALPPNTNTSECYIFRVKGKIENVTRSIIAPWVGDRGLGIQYRLPKTIQWYIEHGVLIFKRK